MKLSNTQGKGDRKAKMTTGSEPQLYMKQLQEYTQKYGLPFPEYRTRNEGFQHAPKFRVRVLIDGQVYESGETFPHRREAEQDAARTALEGITETLKNVEASSLQLHQGHWANRLSSLYVFLDPKYCKLILNEYADKMDLKKPEYTTTPTKEAYLGFISSMVFNGQVYTGEVGGSKKMAEQLAARDAIRSLLEFDSGVLGEIIHSKSKIHDRVFKLAEPGLGLQIAANSEVPIESLEKTIVTFPSTSHMKSSNVNSTRENRSKRQTENSANKKMF